MYLRLIKISQNVDVAPFRPLGSSPIHRCGEVGATTGQGVETEDLEEIEHNLEGLAMDIPDITIHELSRLYQSHIFGISASISRLLCRVAWVIVCYHEKYP
jgi:hypothetical protein